MFTSKSIAIYLSASNEKPIFFSFFYFVLKFLFRDDWTWKCFTAKWPSTQLSMFAAAVYARIWPKFELQILKVNSLGHWFWMTMTMTTMTFCYFLLLMIISLTICGPKDVTSLCVQRSIFLSPSRLTFYVSVGSSAICKHIQLRTILIYKYILYTMVSSKSFF